jgi:uncharacterized protein YigE (DUF2233 family)
MRVALFAFLLLASCRSAEEPAQSEDARAAVRPQASACTGRLFEHSRFFVCSADSGRIEIRTSAPGGPPYRSFAALEAALGDKASDVAFAMNAGMFDEEGRAIGLLVEKAEILQPINRRDGYGNFHMMPNGIFLVRSDGSAEVVTADEFEPSKDIAYASQSGPMLVIDGKLHPRFEPDGQSRHFRNGVGLAPDGTPLFVISADPISFGKLARFFRNELDVRNALYFDGSVSSLWDPANGRRDSHAPLGPMVVVFHGR